jgi:hypothetical protein
VAESVAERLTVNLLANIIGLVVAPIFPALVLAAWSANTTRLGIPVFLGFLPLLYFFSAVAEAIVGGPFLLLALWFDELKWWSATLAGAAIAAICDVVIRLPHSPAWPEMLSLAAVGLGAGMVFWATQWIANSWMSAKAR